MRGPSKYVRYHNFVIFIIFLLPYKRNFRTSSGLEGLFNFHVQEATKEIFEIYLSIYSSKEGPQLYSAFLTGLQAS
jgi:hypothetical protein